MDMRVNDFYEWSEWICGINLYTTHLSHLVNFAWQHYRAVAVASPEPGAEVEYYVDGERAVLQENIDIKHKGQR